MSSSLLVETSDGLTLDLSPVPLRDRDRITNSSSTINREEFRSTKDNLPFTFVTRVCVFFFFFFSRQHKNRIVDRASRDLTSEKRKKKDFCFPIDEREKN